MTFNEELEDEESWCDGWPSADYTHECDLFCLKEADDFLDNFRLVDQLPEVSRNVKFYFYFYITYFFIKVSHAFHFYSQLKQT